jgi:hypothetical protein
VSVPPPQASRVRAMALEARRMCGSSNLPGRGMGMRAAAKSPALKDRREMGTKAWDA